MGKRCDSKSFFDCICFYILWLYVRNLICLLQLLQHCNSHNYYLWCVFHILYLQDCVQTTFKPFLVTTWNMHWDVETFCIQLLINVSLPHYRDISFYSSSTWTSHFIYKKCLYNAFILWWYRLFNNKLTMFICLGQSQKAHGAYCFIITHYSQWQ